MLTMYPAKVNSPATTLASGINAVVDVIPLIDSSILPAAPNLAAIGTGEDTETILYEVINGNNLETVTRGFQGVAKPWNAGTAVARLFTAYDLDTLRTNLVTHDSDADAHHVKFENLIEDATPQLGGDLDAEGHKIHDQVAPYAAKTAAYTTTVDDEIIDADTSFLFGAFTITLGSAACRAGQIILIKDKGGASSGAPITIATEGAELIDGAATDTINRNGFSKQYYSDGSNWFSYSLTDNNDVFGLLDHGLFADIPAVGTVDRLYFASDTKILYRDSGFAWGEITRGETATRLAQLAEKAHGSLTGVGTSDHHIKYTDAEAKAQAEAAKLDDHAVPDDNTDLDASAALHGLMAKADKSKLDGIEASAVALATVKADADVADAISKKHTQGTDVALGAVGTKNPPIDADKALYRDSAAADALVTSTWTQIKAFLKTYFDTIYATITSLATHAAATTGVHGAGANHLALAPVVSHLVRTFSKGWTSGTLVRGAGVDANPTEIKTNLNLFLDCCPFITYSWRNTDRFTLVTTGTAVGNIINLLNYDLKTNANVNSVARLTSDDGYYPRFSYLWAFGINPRTAFTTSEGWLAFMATPGTPSLTQNHWGWRILNGRIYATCGDGTNGTQTDTSLDIAQYANRKFVIQFKGVEFPAVDRWLKYYVDGTLVATHTTNIPIGAPNVYINFYIKNTVVIDREVWISPFLLQENSNP